MPVLRRVPEPRPCVQERGEEKEGMVELFIRLLIERDIIYSVNIFILLF